MKTVTLAVLDDGDCTTWACDAIIIEVPKEDYDNEVFDNGKECVKYFDAGMSGADAVSCVRDILEVLYPNGDADFEWDVETIERVSQAIRNCGFHPDDKG